MILESIVVLAVICSPRQRRLRRQKKAHQKRVQELKKAKAQAKKRK